MPYLRVPKNFASSASPFIAVFFIFVLAAPSSLRAQTAGTIGGTVKDPSGAAVQNADFV